MTFKNIRKIAAGQGDDYTTGCLLDYVYVRDVYKMIAIDLLNNNHQMPIAKQFDRLILLQIQIEQKIQESISFLKKQKKLSQTFDK